jgi:hypothetical protein
MARLMIKPKPGRPPPGLVLPSCLLRRRQSDNTSLIALGQSRRGAAPARSRPTVCRMPEAGRGLTGLRLSELLRLPVASLPLSGNRVLQCPPPSAALIHSTLVSLSSIVSLSKPLSTTRLQARARARRSHDCSPERRMAVGLRQPQPVPPMTKLPTAAFTF